MYTKEDNEKIAKFNAETRAIGRRIIAEGKQEHVDPVRRDEFQAKITAAFKSGYRIGYRAHKFEVTRRSPKRLGRPPKYDFGSIKLDGSLRVDESNTRNVYHCARQWAQRNAPSRKFQVKPLFPGTEITRTK